MGLGVAAVEAGYTIRFARLDEWATMAETANAAADITRFLLEWVRRQLVILDEVGHQKLNQVAGRAFCQLLTMRYTTGSVILTSNRGASISGANSWAITWSPPPSATASCTSRVSSPTVARATD